MYQVTCTLTLSLPGVSLLSPWLAIILNGRVEKGVVVQGTREPPLGSEHLFAELGSWGL